ncbi:MAG: inositol monophosphatase [Chloroflexi bacterium]|nr:inositol monophosphatase [Chloroflexota bacterium]
MMTRRYLCRMERGSDRDRARWARHAKLAAATAKAVGDAIVPHDIQIVTHKKGRANFATAADHAAEAAIIARIEAHDPGVPILAEERADDSLRGAERLWVVDPIDGTLNFSRGVPFYCVAIGYVESGRVRAGAVHAPRTGETFVASDGGGATCNGTEIKVSTVKTVGEAFVVASLGMKEATRKDTRFGQLNSNATRLRVFGSAVLEICYVAMGRIDLIVHSALQPWDLAAPSVIAREAGGRIVSLRDGGEPVWHEPRVMIGNPALVKDALASLHLVKPEKAKAEQPRLIR